METPASYHVPVMVREVLELLDPARGGTFFDGTLGGGGHTEAILETGADARVVGVDRDPEALQVAERRLARFGERLELVRASFADAAERLDVRLAGALLDLGVSSHQIDADRRGFTFREGAPLDMRMAGAAEDAVSAADLLNEASEAELADIFHHFGQERRARRLAAEVVRRRRNLPFTTSDHLVGAVRAVLGPRSGPADFARIFQALRIAVNAELDALDRALPALREALRPGGVLAVLSYHSLEDRRVKHAFRAWSRACVCPPELPVCMCRGEALGETLTRKPVEAAQDEVAANPRARSARLRGWRKAA
ncbi:MAG: 16S rRNA (cytosine(1402)-N(4))-methyltransferase RsmH [Gemmatimonadota bacterium]